MNKIAKGVLLGISVAVVESAGTLVWLAEDRTCAISARSTAPGGSAPPVSTGDAGESASPPARNDEPTMEETIRFFQVLFVGAAPGKPMVRQP